MQWPRPVIGDRPFHFVRRNIVEIALFDFHSQHAFAPVMRGQAHEIAGTTRIAITTFEVGSRHAPFIHLDLLLRSLIVEQYYRNSLITSSPFVINETLP